MRLPLTGSSLTSSAWALTHSDTLSVSTLMDGAEVSLGVTVIQEAFVALLAV